MPSHRDDLWCVRFVGDPPLPVPSWAAGIVAATEINSLAARHPEEGIEPTAHVEPWTGDPAEHQRRVAADQWAPRFWCYTPEHPAVMDALASVYAPDLADQQ